MAYFNARSALALHKLLMIVMLLSVAGFTHCDDLPRTVVIVGASDGDVLTTAQVISLEVLTQHVEVARIELYDGRHKMAEVQASSTTYAWDVTSADNGRHKWQAFAYDNSGTMWPSLPVSVTVDIGPGARTTPRPGVEQRCAELGENCVCNERFNVEQPILSGWNDPFDSSGNTQCAGGNVVETQRGGLAVAAKVAGLPGSSEWVWMVDSSGTQITTVNGNTGTFSNGTMCTRIYARFDIPDTTRDDQRIKVAEMTGPEFPALLQSQFWWFDDNSAGYSVTRWGMDRSADSVGRITLGDCRESWCRIEQCIGQSGGVAQARMRYVRLDDGATMTFTSAPASADSITNEVVWFGNFYTQNVEVGSRTYFSHALQALWPSDEGQWVGPANEIEGALARIDWTRHNVSQSGDRPGNPFPDLDWSYLWIANGFRGQDFFCENPPAGSWREIPHAMAAWWGTDTAGTFIGAAPEVEGGL